MIDKSIRQHYQTGERVDPYRKGLEMIAGKSKGPFQTTAPAKSLIQPTEKMTFPSVKASGKVPPIRTLPTITPPSLDSARYSGLINILPKEEGSYLDKYINRKPVRIVERAAKPTVEDTAAMEDIGIGSDYLTSLVGTDKATTSSDINKILAQLTTSPKTDTAITSTGKGETATSYTDTQMQDIFKNGDQKTKNLITNAVDKTNEILSTLNIDKGKVLTWGGKKIVTNMVGKELGIGSVGGIHGIILANTVGWVWDKLFGGDKKEETGETPKGAISLADKDSTDKEFKVSGTYGGNEVYSSDGSSVDSKTGDITNADGSHGGNIVDEFPSEPAKSTVTYTPPVHHHTGGADNRNDPGGGRGQSPTGRDVAGTPFLKGGRVDKALGGRSRDI